MKNLFAFALRELATLTRRSNKEREMTRISVTAVLSVLIVLHSSVLASEKDYLRAKPEVVEHWKDMRFGMFLCWGPVTLTGKEIGWSRGAPAWGRRPGMRGGKGPTTVEVYDTLYKRWKPDKFDAEAWVKVAKEAGQKYLIFLVKHHDGFCLYDTKLTDYRSTGPESAWKVDVMRSVADACHKHDLKLIIYYSQPDWHHPDYLGPNHDRYIKFLHGQIRELLTNYGYIYGLWFDNLRGWGKNPEAAKLWDAENLFKMARELQPHLIINDRCGLDADFATPEQHVGTFSRSRAWESNITLGTQWAWKPNDKLKSYTEAIRMLAVCACGDGNLALNTNPMPDGRIEPRQMESFKKIGQWMRKYGESIYKTRGGPFIAPDFNARRFNSALERFTLPGGRWWGGSTHRDNVVYLHIMRWPQDTVRLSAIDCKLMKASVLTGGNVSSMQTADGITVTVPQERRDPVDTIVKLEFDRSVADLKPLQCAGFQPVNYPINEGKQSDGNSVLEVCGPNGNVQHKYPIRLAPHHTPATSLDDPLIAAWRKLGYGAFIPTSAGRRGWRRASTLERRRTRSRLLAVRGAEFGPSSYSKKGTNNDTILQVLGTASDNW
jgi:alpha-L-fucosidase